MMAKMSRFRYIFAGVGFHGYGGHRRVVSWENRLVRIGKIQYNYFEKQRRVSVFGRFRQRIGQKQ